MAFPSRTAPAPAGAPSMPPAPGQPPAPAPLVQGPTLWVVGPGGAPVLMTPAQYASLPATTPAMAENQIGGWSTLGAMAASAPNPAPVPAPAGAGFAGRVAPVQAASTGAPRGLFAGVEGAEVVRRGSMLSEGDYIAKVCSAEFKAGRDANFVIIEAEIVTSSYDPKDAGKINCTQEGSRVTIFIKKNDSFANNIKEVILAVSGFDNAGKPRDVHDTVTQQECDALISPEQPFTGVLVYLEARLITTKSGNPFTRISWWPCPLLSTGQPDVEKLMREVR